MTETVQWVRRPLDAGVERAARQCGYTPAQVRVLAGRMPNAAAVRLRTQVTPGLKDLDGPAKLPDIELAANTLADAVQSGRPLICVVDHDVDGSASAAVLETVLTEHFGVPRCKVSEAPSHRMKEGYGVSDALADRLLASIPEGALVVTADQGTTDEPRIAKLGAAGHAVIVTDHHEIPEDGPPRSAVACVNVTRADSAFGDPYICGAHVAWLVCCATRQVLIERGALPKDAPSLKDCLDYVGLAATADAVSMAKSVNNRAVVNYGLHLMNTVPRPAWQAWRESLRTNAPVTAQDEAFNLGPKINARGRLGEASAGIRFLRAQSIAEARKYLAILESENEARKRIERVMVDAAREIAAVQAEVGLPALTIYLADGHAGVHGIVASRLVDAYGRPTACFSPKRGRPGVITGSLRSIAGVNVRDAMVAVSHAHPKLFLSMGGHAGAGGCTLPLDQLGVFQDAFNIAVAAQLAGRRVGPRLVTDGELPGLPSLGMAAELAALAPYGREFDQPIFEASLRVSSVRAVGDGTHLKLALAAPNGALYDGIWFKALAHANDASPVTAGDTRRVAYTLATNSFRGRTRLDLQVRGVAEAA